MVGQDLQDLFATQNAQLKSIVGAVRLEFDTHGANHGEFEQMSLHTNERHAQNMKKMSHEWCAHTHLMATMPVAKAR